MNPARSIQAVTFDAGGTLIEPWPSVGHVYAEVAARQGAREIPPEELNRRFAAAWRSQKDFSYTREAWAEVVDATFAGLVTKPPSQTFFPELYQRFANPTAWRIFDDVEPTLTALTVRGIKLGVISNWDERLRPLLGALRLAEKFQVIVVSCEVGATKPSPAIFEKAACLLGLSPQAILHVGDSAEMDLNGARMAQFKAVQIGRNAEEARDGQITSLRDLLTLV